MKRWIVPALGALAVHAALFSFNWEWARPAHSAAENIPVTLSLLQMPRQAPAGRPVQPLAPPRAVPLEPLPQLKPQPQPPPPRTDPAPPHVPAQEPEPVQMKRSEPTGAGGSGDRPQAPSALPGAPPPFQGEQAQRPAQVDQPEVQASVPLYALNPKPDYPRAARRRSYQGTVVLAVLVDREGRPSQVKVAQSSGYPMLDQSALESVRQWRFEPARRLGQPTEMWVQVPVRFALE